MDECQEFLGRSSRRYAGCGDDHATADRRPVDKFAERRRQLAEAALLTLSELGYARTSLREIAQNSEFSHGVLHYYFRDKVDLITHCVREYKARCVHPLRPDRRRPPPPPTSSRPGSPTASPQTMRRRTPTCTASGTTCARQSMFEASFRDDVAEIDAQPGADDLADRQPVRRAHRARRRVSPAAAYAIFDGLFQQALARRLAGDGSAVAYLRSGVGALLTLVSG